MKWKDMNTDKAQWKEPELTTSSVKWVVAQIWKVSKFVLYNIKRSWRLRIIASTVIWEGLLMFYKVPPLFNYISISW